MTSVAMKLVVQYFARLRETAGTDAENYRQQQLI